MPRIADTLRETREHARLSQGLLARMVGIDEDRLKQIEAGDIEATPEELDVWAQVFGVGIRQLMASEAASAPLTRLFFRSTSEGGLAALEELVAHEAHLVLGEFMRTVRDIAELETMLGLQSPPELPLPPKQLIDALDGAGGEELAGWLRSELGLGLEPIASMKELLTKRLGIHVFWVTPEELHPTIDGASTPAPRPAILVNLVEGPMCWWRTRMTLGHELCHVLCERGLSGERFAMFSPHMPKETQSKWHIFENFESIERRANAFAACLLAPKEAVKRLIAHGDPTSEASITAVGKQFGLGRTTAINRLQRVFELSKQTRASMLERSKQDWSSVTHPDNVESSAIGLRVGTLCELTIEARSRELINGVRARAYLKLPLTEPLPKDKRLTDKQRAPLRTVEDNVRSLVDRWLVHDMDEASCFATTVRRVERGYAVEIEEQAAHDVAAPVPRGQVILSFDLQVVENNMLPSNTSGAES